MQRGRRPKPDDEKVVRQPISMPPELLERAKAYVKETGRSSLSGLVQELLEREMDGGGQLSTDDAAALAVGRVTIEALRNEGLLGG